jgi:ribosomal protein S18 acetylase RimI-like enzyme
MTTAIGISPPAGLRLAQLPDTPSRDHAEARQFCLDTIKEFYRFDYRREWHADLDSLLLPAIENHYSRHHRAAFWILRNQAGEIAATAAIRHLGWKPNIVAMFPERYPCGEDIASIWRVYVRKDLRRHGLGRWLTALCEHEATQLGYRAMYLHATSDALATVAFWQSVGYRIIDADAETTHFDKRLGATAETAAQV